MSGGAAGTSPGVLEIAGRARDWEENSRSLATILKQSWRALVRALLQKLWDNCVQIYTLGELVWFLYQRYRLRTLNSEPVRPPRMPAAEGLRLLKKEVAVLKVFCFLFFTSRHLLQTLRWTTSARHLHSADTVRKDAFSFTSSTAGRFSVP